MRRDAVVAVGTVVVMLVGGVWLAKTHTNGLGAVGYAMTCFGALLTGLAVLPAE